MGEYDSKSSLIHILVHDVLALCIMNAEQISENILTYCLLNNEDQLKTLHRRLG